MVSTREAVMRQDLRHADQASEGPPREPMMASNGMVASAHQFASLAGIEMLRRGGNAVDATIAAAAVLTVVESRNGHLGGDSFFLFAGPGTDGVRALNGSGAAPLAASLDDYLAKGGIPDHGIRTVTVPGTVDCWVTASERFGTLPLGDVLAPAIGYARDGVPVTPRLHRLIASDAPVYRRFPDTARVFLPDGEMPAIGSTLRQTDLARSLEEIASSGRQSFYEGDLAERMVAASKRLDGSFTLQDFAEHRTELADPIVTSYRGFEIFEQPPVSQGIVLLIALNILREFDLAELEPGSTALVHLQIEALKLAFEDRRRYLGDPRYVEVPLNMLLSAEHAHELAGQIDPHRAAPVNRQAPQHPDTTSLCAVDGSGLMVSYIHSLYAGSGVVLGDTGVFLNSRLQGFSLDPQSPNCLAPGKRPVHTLNAYLVQRDGETVLVGGTPGAHWQVQTNLQVLCNVFDFGMDLQAAVEAPRFTMGDQLGLDNSTIQIESRLGDDTIEELRGLGHTIELIAAWASGGNVQIVGRDPSTGVYRGVTEVRRTGNCVMGC